MIPLIGGLLKTERRMVAARSWRQEENGELLFNGYRVSVLQEEPWRWMVVTLVAMAAQQCECT